MDSVVMSAWSQSRQFLLYDWLEADGDARAAHKQSRERYQRIKHMRLNNEIEIFVEVPEQQAFMET